MIRIDKWLGLITNASQFSIPPGATVEQVNVQCIIPGQVTVRSGMRSLALPSGVVAQAAIVKAVRFEYGGAERVVFQDASGAIYSSTATAVPVSVTAPPPVRPSLLAVIPGDKTLTVTVSPSATATGYSFQVSTDGGITWSGAGTASGTAYTIGDLINGQKYYVRVAAVSAVGVSDYTAGFGPVAPAGARIDPASAPPLVTATASAPLSASILWQQPSQDGGSAITGYQIQSSSTSGATWANAATASASSLTETVAGLSAGTTYLFRVAAVTSAGVGQYATAAPVTAYAAVQAPTAPRSPSAVASTTSVVLTWQAPESSGSSAVIDYTVQYTTGGATQTATASGSPYTLTGLTADTTYAISLAARSSVGTGPFANLAPVTTQSTLANTAPSAPTALALTRTADGFTATWAAPGSNGGSAVTGYTLSTATVESGPYTNRYQNTATTTTVTGLSAGVQYFVRVVATNSVGTSAAAQDTVTPGQAPSAPRTLAATYANGTGSVVANLTWVAPLSLYGLPVLYYEAASVTPSGGSLSVWQKVSGNALATSLPVLVNTSYTFGVRAVTAAGTGPEVTLTQTVPDINAPALPGAPRNLSVTVASGSLTVKWDAPLVSGTKPISSYVVTLSNGTTATVTAGTLTRTFTQLVNGTSYIAKVAAVNANGTGDYAISEPAIPFAPASAPTIYCVSNLGSGYWELLWNTPSSNGGLDILRYGIRTNIGASGEFSGAALVAETTGLGPKALGSTSNRYLYKSPTPGTLTSNGESTGRFDVYAITAGGNGTAASATAALPESTTPPSLPSVSTLTFNSTTPGVVSGLFRAALTFPAAQAWAPVSCGLEWSYDGVEWFNVKSSEVPSWTISYTAAQLDKITNRTWDAAFSFRAPYYPAIDPQKLRRHVIRVRLTPTWASRYRDTEAATASPRYQDIPFVSTDPKLGQATIGYSAPSAPASPKATVFPTWRDGGNGATLSWDQPSSDGGSVVESYSVQIQDPATFAITTTTITATTSAAYAHLASWNKTATLRWRVGATNAIGTTYTPWQYLLADNEILIQNLDVDGTAGYIAQTFANGQPTGGISYGVQAGKYRIYAEGSVQLAWSPSGGTQSGPGGIAGSTQTSPGGYTRPSGALLWSQTGTEASWQVAGSAAAVTLSKGFLILAVCDNDISENAGAYKATIIRTSATISAPQSPTVNVNGSTVSISVSPPLDTQGLTLTSYRLQSSLNNSTWTTLQSVAPSQTGATFTVAGQPAGTVYYRVQALSNSVESAVASVTKNDTAPSTPSLLIFGNGPYNATCYIGISKPLFDGGQPVVRYDVQIATVPFDVGPMFADTYWKDSLLQLQAGDYIPPGYDEFTYGYLSLPSTPALSQCWVRIRAVNVKGASTYVRKQWIG